MKKLITTLLIITTSTAFCQTEQFTKILFKVKLECSCSIQLARNDKPTSQIFKMLSDSFLIAIDKGTTGFYITCGKSNTVYMKIPYSPGEGFYKILGKMPCNKDVVEKMTIEPAPNNEIIQ